MTLAQSLTAIIVFWAVIGGLGASLLLPAMQSLIHGNFEGAAQKKVYALVGAAAAIAAAVGPLLGGFITTYLSWRVGVPARGRRSSPSCCRASGCVTRRAVHRVATGRRRRRGPLGPRHGRHRARHPGVAGGRRGGRRAPDRRCGRDGRVARLLAGAPQARGEADADRPRPVPVEGLPVRDHRADAAADRPRRHDDRAADLPADGARVQRHAGRPVARAAVADACSRWRCSPARRPGTRRPSSIIRRGLRAAHRSGWCC